MTCILRMQREAASRHVAHLAPKSDLGAVLGSLGAPWDPLEAPLEHPKARLGRLGAFRGRSRGALGSALGALGAHVGPPEGSQPLPGAVLGGFWLDLEVDLGRFGRRCQ